MHLLCSMNIVHHIIGILSIVFLFKLTFDSSSSWYRNSAYERRFFEEKAKDGKYFLHLVMDKLAQVVA